MKSSLLSLAAAFTVLTLTGCFSVNTNDAAIPASVVVAEKEFKTDIVAKNTKVSGEASVNTLFGFISWGVSEYADDAFVTKTNLPVLFTSPTTVAKQGATYKACKNAKADYILGAKYQIDTQDYFVFKQVKCKVTGFPAELKGIK